MAITDPQEPIQDQAPTAEGTVTELRPTEDADVIDLHPTPQKRSGGNGSGGDGGGGSSPDNGKFWTPRRKVAAAIGTAVATVAGVATFALPKSGNSEPTPTQPTNGSELPVAQGNQPGAPVRPESVTVGPYSPAELKQWQNQWEKEALDINYGAIKHNANDKTSISTLLAAWQEKFGQIKSGVAENNNVQLLNATLILQSGSKYFSVENPVIYGIAVNAEGEGVYNEEVVNNGIRTYTSFAIFFETPKGLELITIQDADGDGKPSIAMPSTRGTMLVGLLTPSGNRPNIVAGSIDQASLTPENTFVVKDSQGSVFGVKTSSHKSMSEALKSGFTSNPSQNAASLLDSLPL